MAQSLKSIADAARGLSPDQQAELIDELVANLNKADGDWSAAWLAEADKRWADHVASGHPGHAADDVLADISARLAKSRTRP